MKTTGFTTAEIVFLLKQKHLRDAALLIAQDMRHDRAVDNLSMIIAIATGEVPAFLEIFDLANALVEEYQG